MLEDRTHCECCGQFIKKLNPHQMDFSKIKILRRIAKINDSHEWVKIQQDMALIKDEERSFTIQCDAVHATRLKWFRLLDLKERRSGTYRINNRGLLFLLNRKSVPAKIFCRGGKVVQYTKRRVFIEDVKNVVLDKAYWDTYQQIREVNKVAKIN